jgi:NAD(P) transhydrogenase
MPDTISSAYELVVIGSGPAGRAGALRAAELGRRVALVERRETVGGVCVNAGTIPSKALHSAVAELQRRHGDLHARGHRAASALFWPAQRALQAEREAVRIELQRAGVQVVNGAARFVARDEVEVEGTSGVERLRGERFLLAVGSEPGRPSFVAFDGHRVVDADSVIGLGELPPTLTVVGAGLVGVEYASVLASLGANVTLVEREQELLSFLDRDLVRAVTDALGARHVTLRTGSRVVQVARRADGTIASHLADGSWISSVAVLYTAGRRGATASLGLEHAGLLADVNGCVAVDGRQRTSQPHIYAAGDVAGLPSLSSSSAAQGRAAVEDAFGAPPTRSSAPLPIALHTVPELASIGPSERELAAAGVPYVVGTARWHELSRGRIDGTAEGFLKLLVAAETRRLVAAHVFGAGSLEIVHAASVALALSGSVDDLAELVLVHPSYSEALVVAARRASGALDAADRVPALSHR